MKNVFYHILLFHLSIKGCKERVLSENEIKQKLDINDMLKIMQMHILSNFYKIFFLCLIRITIKREKFCNYFLVITSAYFSSKRSKSNYWIEQNCENVNMFEISWESYNREIVLDWKDVKIFISLL